MLWELTGVSSGPARRAGRDRRMGRLPRCPSDLTDSQWAHIGPLWPPPSQDGRRPGHPYARHGQDVEGESPLEEATVLPPSQGQLRHRKGGWEGSRRQDLCTEEHELHMRQAEVGELADDSEARHRQRPRCVDAAAVEGHNLLLSGEACPGVVGNGDDGHRKVVADRAGVSRGHSTGGDLQSAGKARTSYPAWRLPACLT